MAGNVDTISGGNTCCKDVAPRVREEHLMTRGGQQSADYCFVLMRLEKHKGGTSSSCREMKETTIKSPNSLDHAISQVLSFTYATPTSFYIDSCSSTRDTSLHNVVIPTTALSRIILVVRPPPPLTVLSLAARQFQTAVLVYHYVGES
ncbi:hypothetical protein BDZ89DRAFT_1042542 [Hymenopellis radicata]|nr:hypothetical protein BDZ89DRAFT_1042542 [Hymenopellis radicata]